MPRRTRSDMKTKAPTKKKPTGLQWVHWLDPITSELDVAYVVSPSHKNDSIDTLLAFIPERGVNKNCTGYLSFIQIAGYINKSTAWYATVEDPNMFCLPSSSAASTLKTISDNLKKVLKIAKLEKE
jgi:hypothetical protein